MKLRHFAVFGGIFTVIICLLLFLFIVTADDEESGSSSLDFFWIEFVTRSLETSAYGRKVRKGIRNF